MAIVFYIILAYILYRVIFNFIIPIVRTTRQVKRSFRDMQDQMNGHFGGGENINPSKPQPEPRPKKGDYIDFEEIKD